MQQSRKCHLAGPAHCHEGGLTWFHSDMKQYFPWRCSVGTAVFRGDELGDTGCSGSIFPALGTKYLYVPGVGEHALYIYTDESNAICKVALALYIT